jgi:hypothetical protein
MNLALSPAFIDVDRMTPTSPNGGKIGARAVIVLAYLILFAAWVGWRWFLR